MDKINTLSDFYNFTNTNYHNLDEWINAFMYASWFLGLHDKATYNLYKECVRDKKIPKEYQLDVLTSIYTRLPVDGTIGTYFNKALNEFNPIHQKERINAIKAILHDKFISDNELIAYRGQSFGGVALEKSISFTTDYDTAVAFANRSLLLYPQLPCALVYTLKVNVDDIGLYYNGREEYELLVRPINKKAKTEILKTEVIHRKIEDNLC